MDSSTTKDSFTTKNKADSPAQDEVEPPPKRMRCASSLPSPNYPGAFPSRLKAVELNDATLNELAAVEHCLWLIQRQLLPLSEVGLKESAELLGSTFNEKQLTPTSIISLLELTELLPLQASRAMTNAKSACMSLLNVMVDIVGANLFLPDNNDLLIQWMSDGRRYSNGERLPAINYGKHPANHQRFLTNEAVHCIRHIVFRFKIPITKFPGLWNLFSILFLRRPLSLDEFSMIAIFPFFFID
jgi:hypothetical protein